MEKNKGQGNCGAKRKGLYHESGIYRNKKLKTRKKKEEIKLKDNDQRDIKNKRRENMYQGKLTIYRGFRYYKKGEVRGQVQRQRR